MNGLVHLYHVAHANGWDHVKDEVVEQFYHRRSMEPEPPALQQFLGERDR